MAGFAAAVAALAAFSWLAWQVRARADHGLRFRGSRAGSHLGLAPAHVRHAGHHLARLPHLPDRRGHRPHLAAAEAGGAATPPSCCHGLGRGGRPSTRSSSSSSTGSARRRSSRTRSPHGYSFPSGHSITSACFYGVAAAILATRLQSRVGAGGGVDGGRRAGADHRLFAGLPGRALSERRSGRLHRCHHLGRRRPCRLRNLAAAAPAGRVTGRGAYTAGDTRFSRRRSTCHTNSALIQ